MKVGKLSKGKIIKPRKLRIMNVGINFLTKVIFERG